jgi:hypothetical protein
LITPHRPADSRSTPFDHSRKPTLAADALAEFLEVCSRERTATAAATKVGLAELLKGGVIMDIVNAQQPKIAEDAGAAAVMALERVPAQRPGERDARRTSLRSLTWL